MTDRNEEQVEEEEEEKSELFCDYVRIFARFSIDIKSNIESKFSVSFSFFLFLSFSSTSSVIHCVQWMNIHLKWFFRVFGNDAVKRDFVWHNIT